MKKRLLILFMLFLFSKYGFSQCDTSVSSAQLNINNINATIDNAGMLWDSITKKGATGGAGYEAPKGGGVKAIFAGGLWIGGIDAGSQLHLAASTYRQNGNDFSVGPINNFNSLSTYFDTVWVMYKSTIDSFKAGLFSIVPHSIKYWPAHGNPNLSHLPVVGLMAPFVDVNGDGIYNPQNGDYPDIKGDEATWEVFNDACAPHKESFNSNPLNIEVHLMTYAFKSSGCLNNTTFYQYQIINYNASAYDSTYIGVFVDPDLGCDLDDYIGCIPALNMGVCYNGKPTDCNNGSNYGNHPPLLGVQMVNLPKNENGDTVHMRAFMYYNNSFGNAGTPTSDSCYYDLLKARWCDNNHLTYYEQGYDGTINTNYAYPSDPADTSNIAWSECHDTIGGGSNYSGDRRFLMSFGPIKLIPGSATTYTYDVMFFDTSAIIYPCPSFSYLRDMAQCIKEANVTGINTPTVEKTFISFYPNPMGEAGTFSFKLNSIKEIKLFNILGEQERDFKTISGTTLQVQKDNLGTGIYFYSALMNNGTVENGKIVIQ